MPLATTSGIVSSTPFFPDSGSPSHSGQRGTAASVSSVGSSRRGRRAASPLGVFSGASTASSGNHSGNANTNTSANRRASPASASPASQAASSSAGVAASKAAAASPVSLASGAPAPGAHLPVPTGLPEDAAAALKQTADTPFARGSTLLTLLPLSARSTTLRLRALTEQLLRRKQAAEARKAENLAGLAAAQAQAKAAGLDPSKSAAELAAEMREIGLKAQELQREKERELAEAEAAAAGAADAAAAAGDPDHSVSDAASASISALRGEVFELRRQLAEKKAMESALGRSLLRAASRHRDAKQTAAFVVAERRGAEDELNQAKTQWAQQSLAARRLFPIVVATSAKLHSIEDQLEKAGSEVGVGSEAADGAAPSATARSLIDVIQQIAATQAEARADPDAADDGGTGSGGSSGMVSTLFHALGWVSDATSTSGTRQLSDDSGDLLRFLSEMDAGSSEFFSPTDAFKQSDDEDAPAGAGTDAGTWTSRRAGVFAKMCEQADLLIEQHELEAGASSGSGSGSVSSASVAGKASTGAGSSSRIVDEAANSVAAGRAAASAVIREAGLDSATPSSSIAAANETVAVEALAWWVLLVAAPSRLSAQLADRMPTSSMLLPGTTLKVGVANSYSPGVTLEAWGKQAEASASATDGDRPSSVVSDFVTPSKPGWPLARASWIPMPAQLRSKAAQALATGDASPAQWYNRSASIEELEEDSVAGAPAGLLLDWMLACASTRGGTSKVSPYKTRFDGVAGMAALLGLPDSVEDALPEKLGGTLGSASGDADATWAVIGRHVVGSGEDGPAAGPDDSTAAVPASVLAALAAQFPSAFASTLLDAATQAGVAVKGRDGARAKRPGALPYGMQVNPGVSVDRAKRLSREGILANAALLAVAEHTGSGLISALPGIESKLFDAAPSAALPSTVFADVCDAADDAVSPSTNATSVVRAINLSRGRALNAGGGFASDAAEAFPLPSSYLAATPEAMAELRAQYSSTDSLHRALFECLADGVTRAFYGPSATQAAVDAEASRAKRMGIPLVTLRTAAPELFHLLMATPAFTELAVSIDDAADVITQSEAEVEAAVLESSATASRQSIRSIIASALDSEDSSGVQETKEEEEEEKKKEHTEGGVEAGPSSADDEDDDDKDDEDDLAGILPPVPAPAAADAAASGSGGSGPQRSVSNAAVKATAFAADTAALLLRVVPALVSGSVMASREQEHARIATVAILRPDLCRVTPEAFVDFMHQVAAANGVSSGLEDTGTSATLRSATPTSSMLDAAGAQVDAKASGWPAEPVDVVPNKYVSLLFVAMRFAGHFATLGASASEGWSEQQQARASAIKAAAKDVLEAASGSATAARKHPRRSDPALAFLAAGRVAQSVVAATRLQQRLAAIKAADAREAAENARVAAQIEAAGGAPPSRAQAHRAPARASPSASAAAGAGARAHHAAAAAAGSAHHAATAGSARAPGKAIPSAHGPVGTAPAKSADAAPSKLPTRVEEAEEDGITGFLRLIGCGPRATASLAEPESDPRGSEVGDALKQSYEGKEDDPEASADPLDMAPGDPTPPSTAALADQVSTIAVETDEIDRIVRSNIAGKTQLPKGGVDVPAAAATEAELTKADAEAASAQTEASATRIRLERQRAAERAHAGKWQSKALRDEVQAEHDARRAVQLEHQVPDHAVPFVGVRQLFAGDESGDPSASKGADEACSVM